MKTKKKTKNKPWICKKCGKQKSSFWGTKRVAKPIRVSWIGICECKKKKEKPYTMDDEYGDGSKHLCCPKCKRCLTCGDCTCRQGWKPKHEAKK